MSDSTRIALILGATGGIGGETALAMSRRGWRIRAFSRTAKPADSSGWEWVKGDATERASVEAAARGVSAIVHAVNPPGYRNWATLVLPMIRKAAGNPSLRVKALPWFIFKLASPFNETSRELCATRPLWETPIDLDNARLVQFLGQEPHTPLNKAVDATLRALGCLAK